ncbi:MAG: MerR family transcriptional regulator [Firmicutes bacterium]|jgi:DNA-binding transcriptional MerR regulator|nr:MerR family transcriptional regulator [Bacillota bacterium]
MDSGDLYTISRLSAELNIPESTLRRYTRQFSEFIPSAGQGRKRRFRQEAKPILLKISQYFGEGLETDQVTARLEQSYQRTVDVRDLAVARDHGLSEDSAAELAAALEQHAQTLNIYNAVARETLEILRQQSDLHEVLLRTVSNLPTEVAGEIRRHTLLARMKSILRLDQK